MKSPSTSCLVSRTVFSTALSLALATTVFVPRLAHAAPIGSIISYQGKLSDNNGAAIADGNASLIFKIYEVGNETAV
ncbi:MAG TPA: hypothetical protein VF719_06170, partial [Abditibacteriaceae bacterium]